MTDGELLSKYAAEGCEHSFRQLVERYLALVQGVAIRKTGRPELGEDVAMQVFAQAARKARALSRRTCMGGWFVLAARLTAAQADRKDRTRIHAMEKAANLISPSSGEPAESAALPWLDDALARLSERERDAVVLHFYSGMNFREIGRREGRSEDAARKRVSTALQKMSRFFQRRGITLSVTAVSSALVAEWAHAQPATASFALTRKALATSLPASSVAGLALTAMNLSKILTAAAVLALCLTPLIWQYREISGIRKRIAGLERTPAEARKASPLVAASTPRPPVPAVKPPGSELNLAALANDFLAAREGDGVARLRTRRILDPMDGAMLESLFESASSFGLPKDPAGAIADGLLEELLSKAPDRAAKLSVQFASHDLYSHLQRAMGLWAQSNPQAALAWFQEQKSAGALKPKEGMFATFHADHEAANGLAAGLFVSDRAAAKSLIDSLPPREAADALMIVSEDPDRVASDYPDIAALAARLSNSQKVAVFRWSILQAGQEDPDQAASFIRSLSLPPENQSELLVQAAAPGPLDETSLQSRLSWLGEQTGPESALKAQSRMLAKILQGVMLDGDEGAVSVILATAKRMSTGPSAEPLIVTFFEQAPGAIIDYHPEEYFAMAAALPAGKTRDRYLKMTARAWEARDPAAAARAMAAASSSAGGSGTR